MALWMGLIATDAFILCRVLLVLRMLGQFAAMQLVLRHGPTSIVAKPASAP
jgi:hypothetical protein